MSSELNSPNSLQEIWQRLFVLLNTNGEFASKRKVEDLLGISFSTAQKGNEENKSGANYLHEFEGTVPNVGFFKMSLSEDPRGISLRASWDHENSAFSHCLNFEKIRDDLEEIGFRDYGKNAIPGPPSIAEFALWREVEALKKRISTAKDIDEESEILHEFENSTPQVNVYFPHPISKCVTGLTLRIPVRK